MDKTKIDWCDSTWNPVTGCLHGCEYCYARKIAKRFSHYDGSFYLTSKEHNDGNVFRPLFVLDDKRGRYINGGSPRYEPYPYGFEPTFHRYRLNDYIDKNGRNIFVCSMADLFGEWIPDSWIEEVFKACEKAPQHNYLFLTKNPKRYEKIEYRTFLPTNNNFWYGSTLTAPNDKCFISNAHYNFWSIEPILAPFNHCIWKEDKITPSPDWIIIGAETGKRKGKVIPKREWIEDIVNVCKGLNIPVFMKSSLADVWGEPLIQEFPEELKKQSQ